MSIEFVSALHARVKLFTVYYWFLCAEDTDVLQGERFK